MSKLESIKKSSKVIGQIGKVFQILFGIVTGLLLICTAILFVLRGTLNKEIIESQIDFDFPYMVQLGQRLVSQNKTAEALVLICMFGAAVAFIATVLMYFIAKIFKRFCNDYSPFLPDIVKDFKIVSILVTLLILSSSIGLGIIAGFVFWGIIQVYEYGCELQNQVDETL